MTVSPAARRFRARLNVLAAFGRFRRSPGDVLTVVSLAFLFIGLASGPGLWVAFLVVGSLLALAYTQIGTAIRILLRGR